MTLPTLPAPAPRLTSRSTSRSAPRRSMLARGLALALFAACGTEGVLVSRASGQVTPDPGSSTDGRMQATYANGRFTLTDTIAHRVLFQSTSSRLVVDHQVTPTIRMIPKPGGADFVYTYTNNTDRALRLGKLSLPGMRLAGNFEVYRFRQDTYPQAFTNFHMVESIYPNGTYSPVQILQADRHIIGVSLLSNAVESNHPVQMCAISPPRYAGDNGQHMNVEFRFSHDYFVAKIPAGTTRTYTVAVRAVPRSESFLKTVVPYRDYFRGLYGPVDYVKDSRPVVGMAVSASGISTETNPRGFTPPNLRPDVHGWGPWANFLRTIPNQGLHRVMLWAPSGCFRVHQELNFPSQFMTGINDIPRMRDTFSLMGSVPNQANVSLGYWWGRSVQVMHGWDTGVSTGFDIRNPQHQQIMLAELDMAVRGGATMVGLDAYVPPNPGDAYRWMQRMKERAPNVKFITENAASDLIHNLAPTFREAGEIHRADAMADFLNPGHETWGAMQYIRDGNGQIIAAPTMAQRQAEMRRIAALGFVPLVYGPLAVPNTLLSVDSSRTTVPRELQPAQSMNTGSSSLLNAARQRRASGTRVITVVPTGP
ncbi:MAG: hypothetical protein ACT4PL_03650 [Phycisphaerales bacterium]